MTFKIHDESFDINLNFFVTIETINIHFINDNLINPDIYEFYSSLFGKILKNEQYQIVLYIFAGQSI